MLGFAVFITEPTENSTIGRSLRVSGRIGQFNGSVTFMQIQFGASGPSFGITSPTHGVWTWSWQGPVPNAIRPGEPVQLIVTASGEMVTGKDKEGDPVTEEANGHRI